MSSSPMVNAIKIVGSSRGCICDGFGIRPRPHDVPRGAKKREVVWKPKDRDLLRPDVCLPSMKISGTSPMPSPWYALYFCATPSNHLDPADNCIKATRPLHQDKPDENLVPHDYQSSSLLLAFCTRFSAVARVFAIYYHSQILGIEWPSLCIQISLLSAYKLKKNSKNNLLRRILLWNNSLPLR